MSREWHGLGCSSFGFAVATQRRLQAEVVGEHCVDTCTPHRTCTGPYFGSHDKVHLEGLGLVALMKEEQYAHVHRRA